MFELGLVTRPSGRSGPRTDPRASQPAPTTRRCRDAGRAVPPQPRRVALRPGRRRASRAGWWGPGRAGRLDRRGRGGARGRGALAVEVEVSADDRMPRGTPAAAPGSPSPTARSWATPGELHPQGRWRRSGCRRAPSPPSSTSTCSVAASDTAVRRTASVDLPGGAAATSPSSSRRTCPAAAVEARPARGGRRAAGVGRRCSTSTAASRSGDGHKSLAYRLVFRAPDRTLTTEEVNALRDRAIASAAAATGAVQRGA